jgi:hypothetical protein
VIFFITIFYSILCFGNTNRKEIELKTLLNHQFSDQMQNDLLENQVIDQSQQLSPTHSLWLTEINSTLELQNDITESFTGQTDNITDSLPFEARVQQRTPYGVSLNLDYYRELGDPSFLNFFNQERYRGSLEFSLLRDPLGVKSRSVVKNLTDSLPLFKRKVESDQCRDIALKYNEALAFQQNIFVIEDTLKSSETILKGLSRAARSGAVNNTTVSIMALDVENLKAQKATAESNRLRALLELQNLSGYQLNNAFLKAFKDPVYDQKPNVSSLQVDLLEQEVDSLKSQLSKLTLDRNHDLSLYTGLESSIFAQNVLGLEGQTDFAFFGIRANIRLADQEFKNRKNSLKSQMAIRENELRIAKSLLQSETNRFLETLKNFSLSYKRLKDGINNLKKTEQRSIKNFRNGKSTYNDYLTSRNQILNYKRALIEAQESFWRTYFNFEHFKGNSTELCQRDDNMNVSRL